MSFNLDSLFIEWRRIVPTGVPNPKNAYHLTLLKEICLSKGISTEIVDSVMLVMEKEEKFTARNKKTGNVAAFGSEESRDKAIEDGGYEEVEKKDDEKKEEPDTSKLSGDDFKVGGKDGYLSKDKKKDGDDSDTKTQSQEKDKELNQDIDTLEQETFARTETEPDDDNFEESNSEYVAENTIDFEREMEERFKPHKFPKKYLKTLGRMLNTKLDASMKDSSGKVKPPIGQLSHYTLEGGAGEIRSQAGELIGMLASSIQDPNEREEFLKMLEEHMDANDDGLIADKSWVKAARQNNQAIDDSLNTEFPDGYEVVASAWDVDSEAEALGMTPPIQKNKGESTDQYLKVKTPDGKTHLVEISLKKDKNIRLTNTSPEALMDFDNFTDEEKEELERNMSGQDIEDVPPPGDGKVDIDDVRFSAYQKYQQEKYNEFGEQNKSEIIRLIKEDKISSSTLKKLKIDPNNPEERLDEILKGGRGTGKTRDKNKLFLQAAQQLPNGQAVIDDVNANTKKVLSNIATAIGVEPVKTKMLESVKEKLPLRSLVSGEESMAVGDFIMDKRTMKKVFGTDDFEKIKDDLQVDIGPPPVIKYVAKGGGEPIVVANIKIREDGVGYGAAMKFDMVLSNDFTQKCKDAHESELNQAKRAS